jgi:uncharacterized repeat protein (TIGR01451 family)
VGLAGNAWAVGTDAGTPIVNTATAEFTVGGTPFTEDSNPETLVVAEFLDVDVTLLTVTANPNNEVTVAPGDTNQVLTFSVTNTGNGDDTYELSGLSAGFNGSGSDTFDPALVELYFDDGTTPGVFDAGDTRYDPGVDEPTLNADQTITIHVLNNIGAGLVDGDLGDSQLTALSTAVALFPPASVAGDSIAAQGDGGGDLVLGTSLGTDDAYGTYLVSALNLALNKSSSVSDPFGGNTAVPGATITYTITAEVTGTGTATGLVLSDDVPAETTYVAESMTLNTVGQTDAIDTPAVDDADFDPVGGPLNNGSIAVDIGDLTSADGVQTITFQVTID